MAWLLLILGGIFECGWAIGLKYTDGFSRLWPTVFTGVSMLASVGLLGVAMREIPVGTAYAVWTGIGVVGVAILGIILLGESRAVARLVCLALIVAGVVGLKLFSGDAHA